MSAKNRYASIVALLIGICTLAAFASDLAGTRADLSVECEVAVALSALPSRLREYATVYVNDGGKYKLHKKGTGPFTCIVERNHNMSIAPQCMDKAGIDSVLPALIMKSELALSGAAADVVNASYQQFVKNGNANPATRPGVSYMMSDYNYIYVENAGEVMKVPPHMMFYAPHLKNSDIGGSLKSAATNVGTPFVFNEGVHGFMINYVEHPSSSDDVSEACQGEIGEAPPRWVPFPQEQ